MSRSEIVSALIVAVLIVGSGLAGTWSNSPSHAADQTKPAPVCQYPDRWTNPPNGCDNSDPAVPECIKAFSTEQGEKDCIATFVAEHEPVQVPEPLPVMEGK